MIRNKEQDRLITYLVKDNNKFVNLELYNGRISKYSKNRCKVTVTFNTEYLNIKPKDIEDLLIFRIRTDMQSVNKKNRVSLIRRARNVYKTQVIEIKELKDKIKNHKFTKDCIILSEKSISKRINNIMKDFAYALITETI
jgi:hypothetical protein